VGRHLIFTRPKTRSSEASVPLTERAVGALLDQWLRQETVRDNWAEAYQDGDLVFARESGEPLRPDFVTKRFRALAVAAGLRPVRLHDLRHGAASLMLFAGVPMAIVSKMLRHSSIGITVDTYHHLDPDTARAASDAIGQLLDAALRDHTATTTAAADLRMTKRPLPWGRSRRSSVVRHQGLEPRTR
jgi:integrase